jgi:hypothetical protein
MKGLPVSLFVVAMALAWPAQARWPTDHRVEKDVLKHWEKTWPEQKVEFVKKKTDCEKTQWEDADYKKKTGKSRMLRACLVKADIFIARGYRYFIYRDTYLYYVKRRLRSVQLGELQKAWKEGGVPAPTQKEAVALLTQLATNGMGASDAKINVQEMGRPRPYGEFYRITLLVDLTWTQDGKQEKREKVFATLQSDGTDWKAVRELAF